MNDRRCAVNLCALKPIKQTNLALVGPISLCESVRIGGFETIFFYLNNSLLKSTCYGDSAVGSVSLTHLDKKGRPHMVDVSGKAPTERSATAEGRVVVSPDVLRHVVDGNEGPHAVKGSPLHVAQLAGIMAAKKTSDLIPLCHPLPIESVSVDLKPNLAESCIYIVATVRTIARTGVEMEALTAVSVAALALYDMLKAADRGVTINNVRLMKKSGGRSGTFSISGDGDE